jgi:hypothetical protein
MSAVTVPTGPNTATIKVLDANGADITGTCSFVASSSDPTVVAVGNPDATTPNVIPLNAVGAPGSSCNITYQAMNSAGQIEQVDTVTLQLTSPASMVVTYGSVIPTVAAKK